MYNYRAVLVVHVSFSLESISAEIEVQAEASVLIK